jgi:hypothetical protein
VVRKGQGFFQDSGSIWCSDIEKLTKTSFIGGKKSATMHATSLAFGVN